MDLSLSDYGCVAAEALDLEVAGASVDESAQQLVFDLLGAELAC